MKKSYWTFYVWFIILYTSNLIMKDLGNKFPIFKNSNCRDNECVPASGSKCPIIQVHTYTYLYTNCPKGPGGRHLFWCWPPFLRNMWIFFLSDPWGYLRVSSNAGYQGLTGVYNSYVSNARDQLQGKKAATEYGAFYSYQVSSGCFHMGSLDKGWGKE